MHILTLALIVFAFLNGCATSEPTTKTADRTPDTHAEVSPLEKPIMGADSGMNTTEDRISTPTS